MANTQHLSYLRRGVSAWNQWRDDEPDVKPDLSNLVFSEVLADISQCQGQDQDSKSQDQDKTQDNNTQDSSTLPRQICFVGANFSEVNLNSATIANINLRDANFNNANLESANITNVNLENAIITNVNANNAVFSDSRLFKTDLEGATLQHSKFWNSDLREINLWNADLEYAVLSGVSLVNCAAANVNLFHANLEDANLEGANLWMANMKEANLWSTNLTHANMSEVSLNHANLQSAILRNTNLEATDLQNTSLSNADIRGANLVRSNLIHANVTDIKYDAKTRYRGIRIAECYGSPRFVRFAKDQDFIEEFRESACDPLAKLRERWALPWLKPLPWGEWVFWLWYLSSDCGRSLWRWGILCFMIVGGFGGIYFHLGEAAFHFNDISTARLPWNMATTTYFSVITFSSLGFGEIVPITEVAAKWVIAEVLTGYIMLGGLISILSDKVARRA